jgi:hypothetical protein
MQSFSLRYDTLIEISTFLVRRWSEDDKITVELSPRKEIHTRLVDKRIILIPIEVYQGDDFSKYRQFRTSVWYEAMRIKFCKKILSNDHAFGFILNVLETRRIEMLGRKVWKGMDEEMIFSYTYQWLYRPMLSSIYGKARIVEGFYQYFIMGDLKGEIQPSQFEKIVNAARLAKEIVTEALKKNYSTEWLEKKIPEILKILDIDSLITIPLVVPIKGPGIMASSEDLVKALKKTAKSREFDFGKIEPENVLEGKSIQDEFKILNEENMKSETKGLAVETIGISIPSATNVDETKIYDQDLISGLKAKVKEWRTGWHEQHVKTGDEFDEETYIEGHEPFFTDIKKVIKSRVLILLDHSSSVSDIQQEYKKAACALCEVLWFLKVKFAMYAFNTVEKQVMCWAIKPEDLKWNNVAAKRLTQVQANGGTPIAEVYDKLFPIVNAKKPDIFLTLSDGEPSDPDAVRAMVKIFKNLGIRMVAIGLGPDTTRATIIANNLKLLGYESTLAVSRLNDIPNKVLNILGRN